MSSKSKTWLLGAALLSSCAGGPEPTPNRTPGGETSRATATDILLSSLPPSRFLPTTETQKLTDAAIDAHFTRANARRAYIQTDKPLYQPGETIWFRAESAPRRRWSAARRPA